MRAASSALQRKILAAIEDYTSMHEKPPTIREIGDAVGIAASSHVHYHLTMLEKQGRITRATRESRGIRLAQPIQPPAALRIEGAIAAGSPLDIFASDELETLDLGVHSRYGPHEYALLVRGDSMVEDGIFDGDHVIVRQATDARNGEIIVALHLLGNGDRGAATLKRYYYEPDQRRIRLQPANASMQPRYIPEDEWGREWQINGIVTAIYRRCSSRA